jgi:hypothetical protein
MYPLPVCLPILSSTEGQRKKTEETGTNERRKEILEDRGRCHGTKIILITKSWEEKENRVKGSKREERMKNKTC